jgi:hypothetical protein
VAETALRQTNVAQKLNSSTNVEPIFVSRHNANAMLPAVIFWVSCFQLLVLLKVQMVFSKLSRAKVVQKKSSFDSRLF